MNLDWSNLQYERTYSATGTVQRQGSSRSDDARVATAGESLQQASVFEQQRLEYNSLNLEIEGDMSLLQEYFGAENTAQRIFVRLGFSVVWVPMPRALKRRWMKSCRGSPMVRASPGPLPEPLPLVSQNTRTLLDSMLDDLRETGNRGQVCGITSTS